MIAIQTKIETKAETLAGTGTRQHSWFRILEGKINV